MSHATFLGEKRMKNVLKTLLSVLVFTLVFSTWSLADGAADFKAKCAMCHGPDGKGETAMGKKFGLKDLGSAEVQAKSDADLHTIIAKGKDKMPGYEAKGMSAAQIDDLVKFIRTLKR
jgi:mono/diheme cytochrome c family protein